MDTSAGLVAGTVCAMTIMLFSPALATEEAFEQQTGSQIQSMDWHVTVVAVVCVGVIVMLAYTALTCTDCYKSEVSTDCHPASAVGGPRWGGAGGYSAAASSDVNRSTLTAGFTGEVVVPEDGATQPLPYALIPTQVPEAQGFRGYAPMESAGAPSASGSGSMDAQQTSLAGYGGSYSGQYGYGSTGVQQSSLVGYRESGGGQYGYGYMGGHHPTLAGYGGSMGGQWGAAAQQGGGPGQQGVTAHRGGGNTGGGRSGSLSGAHIPLMPLEPEEPPPSYFASSCR